MRKREFGVAGNQAIASGVSSVSDVEVATLARLEAVVATRTTSQYESDTSRAVSSTRLRTGDRRRKSARRRRRRRRSWRGLRRLVCRDDDENFEDENSGSIFRWLAFIPSLAPVVVNEPVELFILPSLHFRLVILSASFHSYNYSLQLASCAL